MNDLALHANLLDRCPNFHSDDLVSELQGLKPLLMVDLYGGVKTPPYKAQQNPQV